MSQSRRSSRRRPVDIDRRVRDTSRAKPGKLHVAYRPRPNHRRCIRAPRRCQSRHQGAGARRGRARARPAGRRRRARRGEAGRRVMARQPMAQEGGAAVVPAPGHGGRPIRRRGRRARLGLGQGPAQIRPLAPRAIRPGAVPRGAGRHRAPFRLYRTERGADAVLREPRRLCGFRHHGRHLGDGRLLRPDRQELPHLRRRRHRRRARAVAGRAGHHRG